MLCGSPVDLFCAGLTIAEVYLGRPLLAGNGMDDMEQLSNMRSVLGPFSREFILLMRGYTGWDDEENTRSATVLQSIGNRRAPYDMTAQRRGRVRGGRRVDVYDTRGHYSGPGALSLQVT